MRTWLLTDTALLINDVIVIIMGYPKHFFAKIPVENKNLKIWKFDQYDSVLFDTDNRKVVRNKI